MKQEKYTADQLWEAVKILDDACDTHIVNSCTDTTDVWDKNFDDAMQILRKAGDKVRIAAVKASK